MLIVQLTNKKIEQEQWEKKILCAQSGAVVFFHGRVRNHPKISLAEQHSPNTQQTIADPVTHLYYESYDTMALQTMRDIGQTTLTKYHGINLAIIHRLGHVPVMEISLLIAFAGQYSETSFAAVQFCLTAIKTKVPIWKKEFFQSGKAQWIANKPNFNSHEKTE